MVIKAGNIIKIILIVFGLSMLVWTFDSVLHHMVLNADFYEQITATDLDIICSRMLSVLIIMIGSIYVYHAVDQRRQAIKALSESEKQYRGVVEHSTDGICIVQDELMKYCNEQLGLLLGYSPAELAGKLYADFIHTDDLSLINENYKKFISGEEDFQRYDVRAIHKDGNVIDIELNISVIDYQCKRAGLVFTRDITVQISCDFHPGSAPGSGDIQETYPGLLQQSG